MSECGVQEGLPGQRTGCEDAEPLSLCSTTSQITFPSSGQSNVSSEIEMEMLMTGHFQTKICSAEQLDCVRNVKIDPDICPEKCEGTIADVSRDSEDSVNEEKIKEIIAEYQQYKYPVPIYLTNYHLYSFRTEPRLVVISLKTSMFQRIYKVGIIGVFQVKL